MASGALSAKEQIAMNNAFCSMAAQSPHQVHYILNGERAVPAMRLREGITLPYRKPPNSGWTILVTQHRITISIVALITDIMHARFTYVTKVENAVDFICERDPTLDREVLRDSIRNIDNPTATSAV
ncbi:MAG: hypothetical protein AAF787_22900 [Chloroflexota bacterium]